MFPETADIFLFPIILGVSFLGCILGTFLTKPDDEEVLKNFYRQTKPWGFWKPVIEKIQKEDPSFIPNKNFKRDAFNVLVGIVWQMTLVVMPIYLLIRDMTDLAICFMIFVLTSWLLKKYWYDTLED
jgi:hypothetical protein